MTRWILALLVTTALLQPTRAAQAQSKNGLSINLKSRALVIGPRIRLGEIGVIQGATKKIKAALDSLELGQAPPPGESREITLSYIKNKMRAAGLKKYIRYIKGPKRIRVTTAQVQIDKAILRESVTDYIERHLPASVVRHKIEFRRLPENVAVAAPLTAVKVQVLGGPDLRGFKTFWVDFYSNDRRLARVPVVAYVRVFERVLVADERIARGELLARARLRQEVVETTKLPSRPLAVNLIPRKRTRVIVSSGQILTEADVEIPPLVERGQLVKLVARVGQIEITTKARTQQAGNKSQRIRVRNLESGKVLLATVIDAQTVSVEP